MKTVYIVRLKTSHQGTFGKLITDDLSFSCFTGELPWRDNKPNISCIPAGEYEAVLEFSPKFNRMLYELKKVPNRSEIKIHPANFCGDKSLGYKSDLLGCIALGMNYGTLDGQEAVLNSRTALNLFMDSVDFIDRIKIIIKEVF